MSGDKPVWVRVLISAEDYEAIVHHFAKSEDDQFGKPVVAVQKIVDPLPPRERTPAEQAAHDFWMETDGKE